MRVCAVRERLGDFRILLLDLDVQAAWLCARGCDEPRKMLVQCLPTEREVLLELIGGHEEGGAHRIKISRAAICGQLSHIDVHTQ